MNDHSDTCIQAGEFQAAAKAAGEAIVIDGAEVIDADQFKAGVADAGRLVKVDNGAR